MSLTPDKDFRKNYLNEIIKNKMHFVRLINDIKDTEAHGPDPRTKKFLDKLKNRGLNIDELLYGDLITNYKLLIEYVYKEFHYKVFTRNYELIMTEAETDQERKIIEHYRDASGSCIIGAGITARIVPGSLRGFKTLQIILYTEYLNGESGKNLMFYDIVNLLRDVYGLKLRHDCGHMD
jgi:hypothetical protein